MLAGVLPKPYLFYCYHETLSLVVLSVTGVVVHHGNCGLVASFATLAEINGGSRSMFGL